MSSYADQPQGTQIAEDNILTLLDTSGLSSTADIEDDKLSFLEAVYTLMIVPKVAKGPTSKIYEAVYMILEENYSMVLNVASYLLLIEIDKFYAQQENEGCPNLVSSPTRKDATSSEMVGKDNKQAKHRKEGGIRKSRIHNIEGVVSLMESILSESKNEQRMLSDSCAGKESEKEASTLPSYKKFGLILKLKYFASIIERDFRSCYRIYQATQNIDAVTNTLLNRILKGGANNKAVLRLLLQLIVTNNFDRSEELDNRDEGSDWSKNMGVQAELLDLVNFQSSMQCLIAMIMDLDTVISKKLQSGPRKSKAGIQWVSIWDLITEIVGRETYLLGPLLQVIEPPDYKLKIIFSFFVKNAPQPVVKHLRGKLGESTVEDLFSCFIQLKDVKAIYKNLETDIIQMLLANAFKVSFIQHLHQRHSDARINILKICGLYMIAFKNLQTVSSDFEPHSSSKEALLSAEIVSSFEGGLKNL